jgi:hypothetical protein
VQFAQHPTLNLQTRPAQCSVVWQDQYELDNIYNATVKAAPATIETLHGMLNEFYGCKPGECSKL